MRAVVFLHVDEGIWVRRQQVLKHTLWEDEALHANIHGKSPACVVTCNAPSNKRIRYCTTWQVLGEEKLDSIASSPGVRWHFLLWQQAAKSNSCNQVRAAAAAAAAAALENPIIYRLAQDNETSKGAKRNIN